MKSYSRFESTLEAFQDSAACLNKSSLALFFQICRKSHTNPLLIDIVLRRELGTSGPALVRKLLQKPE